MKAFFNRPAHRFEPLALGILNAIIIYSFGMAFNKDPYWMGILAVSIGLATWRIGRTVTR